MSSNPKGTPPASGTFTPGPWFVSDDPRPNMEWNRHIATDPDGENRICFMANGGTERDDEFEGNARLIAAAPDLYAALESLLRRCETGFVGWPATLGEVESRDMARVALAKARGEWP